MLIILTERNGNALAVKREEIIAAQMIVEKTMIIGEKPQTYTVLFLPYGYRFHVEETPQEIFKLRSR